MQYRQASWTTEFPQSDRGRHHPERSSAMTEAQTLDRRAAAPRRTGGGGHALYAALRDDDPARWADAADDLAPASVDALAGLARRLGEDWMSDRMSFVGVSIAASRLMGALMRLRADAADVAARPSVPVLVPPWEQHSLAAAFAATRLCLAGRHAAVLLDLPPEKAAALPIARHAPAIMVSCYVRPGDRRVAEYLRRLRTALRRPVPILLGGSGHGAGRPGAPLAPGDVRACEDPMVVLGICDLYDSSREQADRPTFDA